MPNPAKCPECGAPLEDVSICRANFEQLLAWETEDMETLGQVHHLTVLCYHLQHPSLYSPEGLRGAIRLLADFLEGGLTTQEVRRRDAQRLNSSQRKYKIKGTTASHGAYQPPVRWTMTAADVAAGGSGLYVENVKRWADSILAVLKAAGQLDS